MSTSNTKVNEHGFTLLTGAYPLKQTLPYQIVDKYYPESLAQLAVDPESLPGHVHPEFADFL